MHSSRMHTAHMLPLAPSMHCLGVYLVPGAVPAQGVYLPWGCTWSGVPGPWGVPAQRGVPARGCVPARTGVPAWEGVPA